jgi:hypothetical protein
MADEAPRKAVEQGKVSKGTFRNYYGPRPAVPAVYEQPVASGDVGRRIT